MTVSLASTTAAALAFLITRYLARDKVARQAQRFPRFEAIDRAIGVGKLAGRGIENVAFAIPASVAAEFIAQTVNGGP